MDYPAGENIRLLTLIACGRNEALWLPDEIERDEGTRVLAAILGIDDESRLPPANVGIVTLQEVLEQFRLPVQSYTDHDYALGNTEHGPTAYHIPSGCFLACDDVGNLRWSRTDQPLAFKDQPFGVYIPRAEWIVRSPDTICLWQLAKQKRKCYVTGEHLRPETATMMSLYRTSDPRSMRSANQVWVSKQIKIDFPGHNLSALDAVKQRHSSE